MPTYLNNWNPARDKWRTNAADSYQTQMGSPVRLRWSASGTKAILPGDRVFLGRQGTEPKDGTMRRGVIASGIAVSPFFEDKHWEDLTKSTTYNIIDFDTILTPQSALPRNRLKDGSLAAVKWGIERGGVRLKDDAAAMLEQRWADYLDEIGFGPFDKRLANHPFQPDPRKRKAVEDAAIQETIRHFRAWGYTIRDRQKENVGWDLEAVKGAEVLLLEVKGSSGTIVNAELTPNEYAHMQGHCENYAVCTVVDALAPGRSLSVFRFCSQSAIWKDSDGRILSTTELIGARLSI